MRLAVLGGTDKDKIVLSLLEDILSLGVDCKFVNVNHVSEILNADAVYATRHALKIDYDLLSKRVRLINSYDSAKKARSKIKTTNILAASNIPQPDYVLAKDYESVNRFARSKELSIMKFPYGCAGNSHAILEPCMKGLVGHTSNGKFDVINHHDHITIGKYYFLPPYLVQEFISSEGTHTNDNVFRAYVVGREARFGTIRKKDCVKDIGDSLINIALGARYEFIPELDKEISSLAIRTADAVGFDIGVVDLLKDKDGNYYVIECDCDGRFLMIDRKFMQLPDYSDKCNFNKMIGQRLVEIASGADYRQ